MPEASPGMTIPGLFEAQAARTPEAVAIQAGTRTMSYDGLNRAANRLARAIRERVTAQHEPVAVLLEDGVEEIVAVLALFKAGRIAVPLDPGYPPARLRAMLEDSRCALVLGSAMTARLRARLAPELATLDAAEADHCDDANPSWKIDGAAPANIYYTSGSTGEPKGVVQTQRNVLRFVQEMAEVWEVVPDDRFIQLISTSFSAVLLPILVPLLHGACVVPWDLRREGAAALSRALAEQSISVLFCVPSVFRAIPPPEPDPAPARLRLCVFTGEPLHWSDVARLRQRFGPGCAAVNVLGGSEMHHVASLRIAPQERLGEGVVPAGRPAPGKELALLDAQGEPVPAGAAGELLVRGRYLSPGYWRRPDLNREAFIEAPDGGMRGYRTRDLGRFNRDGLLELLGRVDSRVKLRGQMVDTAAVEAAIAACPGIAEAAVDLAPDAGGTERLVAFVSGERPGTTPWPRLREHLAAALPGFMVPSSFFHLPVLPRTPGGKIDRNALAGLHTSRRCADDYVAPRNDLERRIADVVEALLGQHPIGVRDDLFERGLDSLRYAELHVALEEVLCRRLPDEVFVRARTVEQLAGSGLEPLPGGDATVPGGGHDYGKSWRRLDREMRARFLAARLIGWLPFRWSFAGLNWLSKRAAFRQAWPARRQVVMIRFFLATVDSAKDADAAIARSLCCNYSQPWLLRSMARAVSASPERYSVVEGLEHFRRARAAGRGVILAVSHFGIPHADLLVLERTGETGIVTLGAFEYELELMGLERSPHIRLAVEPAANFEFRANFLRRARSVLKGGGVVRIAADGLHGTGGRTWPFHGRNRHFRPGLGEVALETGAPVVPVFGVLAGDGRLQVEFLPPLEAADAGLPKQAAVDHCLGQYLLLLEKRWALDPGSVVWEIARAHLAASGGEPA